MIFNKYSLTQESLLLKDQSSIDPKIPSTEPHAFRRRESPAVCENPPRFSLGEPPVIGGHAIRIRPATELAGQRGGQYGLAR